MYVIIMVLVVVEVQGRGALRLIDQCSIPWKPIRVTNLCSFYGDTTQ